MRWYYSLKKIEVMKKKFLIPLSLLFFSLLTWQCSFKDDMEKLKDAVDSVHLIINTPEFESTLHMEFVDAKTKEPIVEHKITIYLTGENAEKVLSNIGAYKPSYVVKYGFVDLVVEPTAVEGLEENPMPVDFVIESEGYLKSTQRVFLTGAKFQTEQITLVQLDNTPQGVNVSQTNNLVKTNNSGIVEQTSTQRLAGEKQTMKIPQGVALYDEDGKAITGNINSEIVFFEPNGSKESKNVFPGGYNNITAKLANGSVKNVAFVSLGAFSVNLNSQGKKVKFIDSPGLELKTEVLSDMVNPKTGENVKAGDQIDVWSKDENAGVWKYEGTTEIQEENGTLFVKYNVEHLSYWLFAWYENTCSVGTKLSFSGQNVKCQVAAWVVSEGAYINFNIYNVDTENNSTDFSLINCPIGLKSKIFLFGTTGNSEQEVQITPSVINIDNLCSQETKNISVVVPPLENSIHVNFDLSYQSKNGKIFVRPMGIIHLLTDNSVTYSQLSIQNGKGSMDIQLGKEYLLFSTYDTYMARGKLLVERISDTKIKATISQLDVSDDEGKVKDVKPIEYELDIKEGNVIDLKYNAVLPDDVIEKI